MLYNIFYKNQKINNKPLNIEKLNEIQNNIRNGVIKVMKEDEIIDIPFKDVKIIKCIIV